VPVAVIVILIASVSSQFIIGANLLRVIRHNLDIQARQGRCGEGHCGMAIMVVFFPANQRQGGLLWAVFLCSRGVRHEKVLYRGRVGSASCDVVGLFVVIGGSRKAVLTGRC